MKENYWEAWRVAPGQKAPALKSSNLGVGMLDRLSNLMPNNFNTSKMYNVKANDWFWNAKKSGTGTERAGLISVIGEVFYIDCVGENEGPGTWDTSLKQTGGLPGLLNAGNEASIANLFEKYPPIGPFSHAYQEEWNKSGTLTEMYYEPK